MAGQKRDFKATWERMKKRDMFLLLPAFRVTTMVGRDGWDDPAGGTRGSGGWRWDDNGCLTRPDESFGRGKGGEWCIAPAWDLLDGRVVLRSKNRQGMHVTAPADQTIRVWETYRGRGEDVEPLWSIPDNVEEGWLRACKRVVELLTVLSARGSSIVCRLPPEYRVVMGGQEFAKDSAALLSVAGRAGLRIRELYKARDMELIWNPIDRIGQPKTRELRHKFEQLDGIVRSSFHAT